MCRLIRCVALSLAVLLLCSSGRAEIKYVDIDNPKGIPLVTQGPKGICAAATATSVLWNWGSYAPFNNASNQLFPHSDPNNYQSGWTGDTASVRDQMATLIYGPPPTNKPAYGLQGALAKWIGTRKYLYPKIADGLSVFSFYDPYVTYDYYTQWVSAKWPVIGDWRWHDRQAGTYDETRHTLGGAGWDTTNASIIVTNSWFGDTLNNNAPPVDSTRYTQYKLSNANGSSRPKISAGTPANDNLLTDTTKYDYLDMTSFTVVQRGKAPTVAATIYNNPGRTSSQTIQLTVTNFDSPGEIHNVTLGNVFVELPDSVIAAGVLASAPPDWTAEQWNVASRPDLFEPAFRYPPGASGSPYVWDPGFTGIHWIADSAGIGIAPGQSLTFSLQTTSFVDPSLLTDLLAVTGDYGTGVLNFQLTSVPEPAGAMLVYVGLSVLVSRAGFRIRR